MRPLLSAALITRDESKFLAGCLSSLAGVVDEIVVVDTGSIDATPEIARGFGAKVVHHPWRDDFSDARNVSLDVARGRWILYIDADERLVDCDRSRVERLLEETSAVAFRVLFRPTLGATPYREYRLWRSDPRIRFEGVIHEKVVPSIHRVADEDRRPVELADLMLVHLGYEGDQTRKHVRNLPLLRRQLALEPDNLFAWHHLARVLDALGDPAGSEQALRTAVEIGRRTSPPDPLTCLSYADLIRDEVARGSDAAPLLAEALAAFPDNCVLLWLEAQRLMALGRYGDAIGPLNRILAVDWALQPNHGPAYDTELVAELPWSAKALCLFRLGEYAASADAYAEAGCSAPDDPSYRVKAQLARARARRAASVGHEHAS